MYVSGQMEFKEIASELKVSERSLRVWGKKGSWKEKREAFLNDQTALKTLLVKFALSLTRHLMTSLDDSKELTQTKVQLLRTVLEKAVPTPKAAPIKEAPAEEPEDRPQQNPIEAVKQYLGL